MQAVFIWTEQSGRPGRVRFLWWPLLISIAFSILLTILLNALI